MTNFRTISQNFRVELRRGEGRSFRIGRAFFYAFREACGRITYSPLIRGANDWAVYMPLDPAVSKAQRKVMLGIVRSRCTEAVPLPH